MENFNHGISAEMICPSTNTHIALKQFICYQVTLETVDILPLYIPNLPKEKGNVGIGGYGAIKRFEMVKAVTPYWLFEDFKKLGTPYKIYPTNRKLYRNNDPKQLLQNEFIKFNTGAKDEVIW